MFPLFCSFIFKIIFHFGVYYWKVKFSVLKDVKIKLPIAKATVKSFLTPSSL